MDALVAEADLWARSAMNLSADSLSTMRRISKAQTRRFKAETQLFQVETQVELKKGVVACH